MSDEEGLETIRRAITAVRREGYKVAVIYAILDGTLAAMAANVILSALRVEAVPRPYSSAAIGVLVAILTVAYRVRRPLIERFEAINPEVHEALRTARDTVEDGDTSPMARALYADVVDRLQNTSSVGLLNLPAVAVRFVLVFALSIAVVQASMVGVDVGAGPAPPAGGGGSSAPPAGPTPTPGGLQPGDEVLGAPETVTPAGENLSAVVDRQVSEGEDELQREYETGGLGSDGSAQAERVGYAPPEDLENAELIKAYNLRIREEADD